MVCAADGSLTLYMDSADSDAGAGQAIRYLLACQGH
jgi:hypothetical protein